MNRYVVEIERHIRETISLKVEAPDKKSLERRLEDIEDLIVSEYIDWASDFEAIPRYSSYVWGKEEDYDPNKRPDVLWEEIK